MVIYTYIFNSGIAGLHLTVLFCSYLVNSLICLYFFYLYQFTNSSKHLPSGDVARIVAVKGVIVEDGTLGASNLTGVLALVADIEEAAVTGFEVASVVEGLAVGVHLGLVGAAEAVGEDLCAEGNGVD